MSGAYADVGAGAKPPVAGIGFFVWRIESEQRETGRKRVQSGRRYCDGFERNAGANQPFIRLAMDSQKGGQSSGKSKVPYVVG